MTAPILSSPRYQRGLRVLAVSASAWIPFVVHAQSSGASPSLERGPSYQIMRFDERWANAPRAHDRFDALKHLPMPAGNGWVTLAGQWRGRAEDVQHYQLLASPAASDLFSAWRLNLSADVNFGALPGRVRSRLFAEWRDAHTIGRALAGGTRPQDEDVWDVQNLFADIGWRAITVRAGRQELALGRERVIGISDWSNARRGTEGVRVSTSSHGIKWDLFRGRPITIRSHARNLADTLTHLTLASVTGSAARASLEWQVAAIEQAVAGPSTGRTVRRMLPLRVSWRPPSGTAGYRWLAESEAGPQWGWVNGARLRAWYATTDLTLELPKRKGTPSLTVGVDGASGGHSSDGRLVRTYQVLYPSLHSYGGFADVLGRANVLTQRASLTLTPRPRLQLRTDAYAWSRLTREDGVYTKSGAVLRSATASDARAVGRELDATATLAVDRHTKVQLGAAHVFAGPVLLQTRGAARGTDWAFASLTYTW